MFVFTFLLYLQKESSFMKNNFLSLLFILLNINFLNAQKINQIKVLTSSKPKIDAIAPIQKVENFPSEKAIQPLESEISIFINPSQKFQNIIGFGGAITDATAQTFANSIPQVQNKLLQMLFDQECGLSYNLIRTNMNSCDFSSESYTYIQENDTTLKTFDIAHDLKYKIPLISRAMNMIGVQAKLYISPWSPPAFMKSNHQMKFGGKLLPKYYDLWAKYFVKYIQSI
jgi:glucosylceramidase